MKILHLAVVFSLIGWMSGCASWTPEQRAAFARSMGQVSQQYQQPVQNYNTAPATSTGATLEGCIIVAEDGQMLGVITSNAYDSKSFLNEYGSYGGKYSATSIWNEYGQYGGQYSSMSPFNPYSNTPPRIVSPRGGVLGFLTVNQYKTPSISPFVVVALMK